MAEIGQEGTIRCGQEHHCQRWWVFYCLSTTPFQVGYNLCPDLSEECPSWAHICEYLASSWWHCLGMSTWPPVGGAVWEGPGTCWRWSLAGGSAWLEMGLRVCNLASSSLSVLCLWLEMWSPSLWLWLLAAMLPLGHYGLSSLPEIVNQSKFFFSLSCLWPWCFVREQQKVNILTYSWCLTVPRSGPESPLQPSSASSIPHHLLLAFLFSGVRWWWRIIWLKAGTWRQPVLCGSWFQIIQEYVKRSMYWGAHDYLSVSTSGCLW